MNNADWLKELRLSFEAVSVYRNIIKDPVVNELNNLIDCLYSQSGKLLGFAGCYSDFFYTLSQKEPTLSLPKYMIYMVLYDENVFTMQAQAKEYKDIDPLILNAAKTDLRLLHKICAVNPESLIKYALEKYNPSQAEKQILLGLPRWDTALHEPAPMNLVDVFRQLRYSGWEQAVERLAKFHYNNGAGIIARYRGFVWRDNKLVGVKNPDNIKLSDLVGYERERAIVVENTLQFLRGGRANNILLYGDRGTGKSSTVKALFNEYHNLGLRMIELKKEDLAQLDGVINEVSKHRMMFIVFIDDLSFDDNETQYTQLKAVLEGSLQSKPDNLIIYATSNRRHLVTERFGDRDTYAAGGSDLIHVTDLMQEKLSLADRFGITVTFNAPDQQLYLRIVEHYARKRRLDTDIKTLHEEAIKWEMRYNGRSPRTAKQFIDWYEGQLRKNC